MFVSFLWCLESVFLSVWCLLTSWSWTRKQISFDSRWIIRCWTERAENMHLSHVSDWLTQWMSWALISTTHRPSTDCRVCQHEMAREEQLCIGVDSVSLVYGVERHQWLIVLFCFCKLMHDEWVSNSVSNLFQLPTNCPVCRYCTCARWSSRFRGLSQDEKTWFPHSTFLQYDI